MIIRNRTTMLSIEKVGGTIEDNPIFFWYRREPWLFLSFLFMQKAFLLLNRHKNGGSVHENEKKKAVFSFNSL